MVPSLAVFNQYFDVKKGIFSLQQYYKTGLFTVWEAAYFNFDSSVQSVGLSHCVFQPFSWSLPTRYLSRVFLKLSTNSTSQDRAQLEISSCPGCFKNVSLGASSKKGFQKKRFLGSQKYTKNKLLFILGAKRLKTSLC